MPVFPIDEELLNVEQAVKALEESVTDSLIAVNASITALRKAMTKKELVETPRQFANQEEQTEDLFIGVTQLGIIISFLTTSSYLN